ncbi:Kunitz inhibitor ST1-like protein [Artemisia annua]|uniref:Kunitz inhibitor ST1-like protein n=1 Tax=Artemisia annua TaxID=35608 RepID=A0A2U1PIU0_ARTAN|nr:Kunitz inhibitor ST1-like protein [Artemisia annua]
MKSLFIFIVVLSILSLSSSQSATPVRDTDRNILRSGTNYYILPVNRGSGGGITLAPGRDEPCPFDVAQENNELNNGSPWHFEPANPNKENTIYESTDLNVRFSRPGQCLPNPVWRFEYYEEGRIVSSHGMVGSPGKETIRNWFKIQKYEDDYKFVYCPSVCQDCRPYCADIGSTIAKNGRRVLALNNKPLKVKFKKAI